jgi:RNA polymerase primary sigma factor
MDLSRNWHQDELDGSDIERPDIATGSRATEPAADDAAQGAGGGDVVPANGDAAVEAPSPAGPSGEDGAVSRDLIALYFREMGDVELLSRADELALAQRIEAQQLAMVEGLAQVPMLIDRIGLWVDEVHQGSRAVRDLVDLSLTGDALAEPADGAETEDEDRPGGEAHRGGQLPPETMARLDGLAALAGDILALSRKRMTALARGRNLTKPDRARLADLHARAAREIGLLRLHPDRIADLLAALEDERRNLDRIERGPTTPAGSEELTAFARRVGLPTGEFRDVTAQVNRARRDARRAREEMVRAHLPLVVAIAKRYRGRSSLDLLDLIQEGNLGLMHAVEKYDHRRGVKVSTYAVWWIRQAMTRAMADQGRLIRVPLHMTEQVTRVLRERRKLSHKLGRNPETDEIAARVAMSAARVEKALSLVREPVSLDVPVGADGDATLGDLIEAPDAVDPHAVSEASALKQSLAEALSSLSEREQRILRMRFGIGGTAEHTLAEVGEVFGLTRERIRQIEASALAKLRQPHRGRKLLTFAQA